MIGTRGEDAVSMSSIQTVSLGMGCFWTPDALFGHMAGVIRTRVGFAGGYEC
ncbi:peptide-methionine (S)-S-oxide reductase [Paenibacillus sp. N3.4]|uniref:peptide-methionine (S)-S-oxide reductase n=1 Tax=Paenibacillus sp. N3.4 TaxID=2603222 RepID=UPI0021C36B3E|nr:peptide-methionine (S)-S-oxide reductase [Paenibacillus sp. N3.4]